MPRQALRAALGRATPSTTARALSLPISSTTPTSFFSTTPARPDDNNSSNGSAAPGSKSAAAVQKLAQLNRQRQTTTSPAAGRTQLGRTGGVDARSLRVSPIAASGDAGSSSSAPKILNVRSLRGGLRSRTPFGRGGLAGGAFGSRPAGRPDGGEGGLRPRVGFGAAGRRGGGFGFPRSPGRGSGIRGRRDFRKRQLDGAKYKAKNNEEKGAGRGQKLEWTREEQAVIDRLEKGEVVPFEPQVTLDALSGYGAAVATDAPIGQVETALRTMRLMTGGMAFNSDSGVTADLTEVKKRYLQRKPVFLHSKGEKEWIESANPKMHFVGPDAGTKKAIMETALRGKYEAPGFAELGDVKGIMANYHSRTFTYMAADSKKFMDKVLSLLPAQGGSKPADQAKR